MTWPRTITHVDPRLINGCCHPSKPLCDRCVDDCFKQLGGTAACRGEFWAMDLAKDPKLRAQPWPGATDKVMRIARQKCADLTRDERLLEQLAAELARWAERWWSGSG